MWNPIYYALLEHLKLVLRTKKAKSIFLANDNQHFHDSTHKLTSLKQIDHGMTSFIVESQSNAKELKIILELDSFNEIKKLDKFYMVMILRVMHPNFDHVLLFHITPCTFWSKCFVHDVFQVG